MNVVLKPELEKYVASKVASGLYPTPADVVQAGLELLREAEEHQTKLAELRREVQIGLDQADRGDTIPLTPALIEEIWNEGFADAESEGKH